MRRVALRVGTAFVLGLGLVSLPAAAEDAKPTGDSPAKAPSWSGYVYVADVVGEVVKANDSMPEYCAVTGTADPKVQFEARLPNDAWNGKFYQAGCGGFCGDFNPGNDVPQVLDDFKIIFEMVTQPR